MKHFYFHQILEEQKQVLVFYHGKIQLPSWMNGMLGSSPISASELRNPFMHPTIWCEPVSWSSIVVYKRKWFSTRYLGIPIKWILIPWPFEPLITLHKWDIMNAIWCARSIAKEVYLLEFPFICSFLRLYSFLCRVTKLVCDILWSISSSVWTALVFASTKAIRNCSQTAHFLNLQHFLILICGQFCF